jgi:phosphohistidine phosphatase
MGSYMALRQITPDLILSSMAFRAQLTADRLAKKIEYKSRIHYMEELYMVRPKTIMNILSLQDDMYSSIFLIGHNPELTEFANILIDDDFSRLPTLGILAIDLDIESWSEIGDTRGVVDFFIYPKQFRYYIPKQIRTTLA